MLNKTEIESIIFDVDWLDVLMIGEQMQEVSDYIQSNHWILKDELSKPKNKQDKAILSEFYSQMSDLISNAQYMEMYAEKARAIIDELKLYRYEQ